MKDVHRRYDRFVLGRWVFGLVFLLSFWSFTLNFSFQLFNGENYQHQYKTNTDQFLPSFEGIMGEIVLTILTLLPHTLDLRHVNPLIERPLNQVLKLVPFVYVLLALPCWQQIQPQFVGYRQYVVGLVGEVTILKYFVGIHHYPLALYQPIGFFTGLRDGLEEKVISIGIVFKALLIVDEGLGLIPKQLDILDEGFLIIVQYFKIFLFFQQKGFLELFQQQIELQFYLTFDMIDSIFQFFKHDIAFFNVLQNTGKFTFSHCTFIYFFQRRKMIFEGICQPND